jgi:hypothetical protein
MICKESSYAEQALNKHCLLRSVKRLRERRAQAWSSDKHHPSVCRLLLATPPAPLLLGLLERQTRDASPRAYSRDTWSTTLPPCSST